MSSIQIKDLSFTYPGSAEPVFDHVSFQLDTDWKTGLVGRNGRGKTTLLQLLMGNGAYSGAIVSSVPCSYFPYAVPDTALLTGEILQTVCPQAEEWEFLREFPELEIEPEFLWRPFFTLSHGEQTKVLLAALMLRQDQFLLIDEPTNHLDTEGRRLTAEYLRRRHGFLLVSHDRQFLDSCTDHTIALARSQIEVVNCSFSAYWQNFNRRQNFEQSQNEKLNKEIARLEQSARDRAVWSGRTEKEKRGAADKGFVGHKSAKMMRRSKSLETRQQNAAAKKRALLKNAEKAEPLKLQTEPFHADRLALFQDVTVFRNGQPVCGPLNFEVHQNSRIVLEGRNGSGKSTILHLFLQEAGIETRDPQLTHTGTLWTARGLKISVVPQETGALRGTLKEFAAQSGLSLTLLLSVLRKMDFSRSLFEQPMESYSEGQKKKVLLAKSICQPTNLYLWDEPLNYIDIYTRMQLERLIQEYAPSMLFVEHDLAFQRAVANEVQAARLGLEPSSSVSHGTGSQR